MKQNEVDNSKVLSKMMETIHEEAAKRTKQIMKRNVPEERTLANALLTLNKQELDDIRYNVGLSGTSNLKKSELIEKLVPAIVSFAQSWFVSIVDEQYQAFNHVVQNGGISTEFREDEMRLDYFQSVGVLFNGAKDGKVAWYMPNEIMNEFKKFDNGSLAKEVEWNTDVLRIAGGILFYYGVLDYDQLFSKVKGFMEERDDFKFVDFMGVIYNGACWQHNIVTSEKLAYYYTVMDPKHVADVQNRMGFGFAKLSYGMVYDAGDENYIESSNAYQALAQYFMHAYNFDVLKAANVVGQITMILQNGGKMSDVMKFVEKFDAPALESDREELAHLLVDFNDSLHMWLLKGHTPVEIVTGKLDVNVGETEDKAHPNRKKRVGRNDPCPCGSGKKYKNCCMRKDMAAAEAATEDDVNPID